MKRCKSHQIKPGKFILKINSNAQVAVAFASARYHWIHACRKGFQDSQDPKAEETSRIFSAIKANLLEV